MFEGLFDEGEESDGTSSVGRGLESLPAPRLACGLSGIDNQGATCYLNSLLQTLLYTPEFRECLFRLDKEDLGELEEKCKLGARVRVIPIQLRRLFARLLLGNRQSVSTTELTDSFGWTNHEELQQQDVQELNRILFCAIEDSLIGTAGQNIISNLYHGNTVNQIICQECGRISEREEDFLDLTLTVSGNSSIEHALSASYCETELMDGRNQYRCERCQKLVNATKGAKIRSLPAILTLSLLRFSFDFQKMERFKESSKMTFPTDLDMKPFIEKSSPDEDLTYELFSVVIHQGGAYGGHYRAYIRDVDILGHWMQPHEEEIRVSMGKGAGTVNFIDVGSPADLIEALLERASKDGMAVDKLCGEMSKQTGVSWNKRFKKHYGPIHKFLKRLDDRFIFDQSANWVSLKLHNVSCHGNSNTEEADKENIPNMENLPTDVNRRNEKEQHHSIEQELKPPLRPSSPEPPGGHCWFNFDDSRVHPISAKEIEKQFFGKESAYMLFYRKRSLTISRTEVTAGYVPDDLVSLVMAENEELERRRKEYDKAVNKVTLQVHFGMHYEYKRGALQPIPETCHFMEFSLDRRKHVTDLVQEIKEIGEEMIPGDFVMSRLNELPSGGHLYESVSGDEFQTLQDCGIVNGTKLFIWDGNMVHGIPVPTGADCEPICLTVIYGNPSKLNRAFPKNVTLAEFKAILSDLVGIETNDLDLQRWVSDGQDVKAMLFTENQSSKTLEELKLKDGDEVTASSKQCNRSDGVTNMVTKQNTCSFSVENRCGQMSGDSSWPKLKVKVDNEASVGELKLTVLSKAGLCDVGQSRLRVDHPSLGLRAPLYEEMTLRSAHVEAGTPLVLEPGPAPLNNQMTLTFTSADPKDDLEVMVERSMSVGVCLAVMIDRAGYTDDSWHLRKTNWCGEAADILDDIDVTLEEVTLQHGDHVLLEQGKLPPKGFLRVPVYLYPSPDSGVSMDNNDAGMITWIAKGISGLLGSNSSSSDSTAEPLLLGEVEISKEATLEDLKLQILTLPFVCDLPVPTPYFLRVRLIENGSLTTVLRGHNVTLQRLKLKASSQLSVQALAKEENLTQHQIVLNFKQRIPETRYYAPAQEIVWDTANGATVGNLRQVIADSLILPVERVVMAKHFPDRFEWTVIQEMHKKAGSHKGKKKGGQPKSNLKTAPYHIKDGDVIGVKDSQYDPDKSDNFCTEEDDKGREQLRQAENEKRLRRRENQKNSVGGGDLGRRRQEVGLTIKVDRFT